MTFLNPGLLWGLVALAVPIIIHFFNLQRPQTILFSNVEFVKEVKKTVVKRIKFKQWLLLISRLLALGCLVFAFANPVWISGNSTKLVGNRSVAIVIDNSYSMKAGNERGEYFQQALTYAKNIANAYGQQDELLLMSTSQLKRNYNFLAKEEALEAINETEIKQNLLVHSEILGAIPEIFSRANHNSRELYFISDFQTSTVLPDSQQVRLPDSSTNIYYIPIADRKQANAYIASHRFSSQIIEQGKAVNLEMKLVNDGESDINEVNIRVMLNGQAVALDNEDISAKSEKDISISFTPNRSGWQSGYIELDDYPIDFDNKRYFSLYVPNKEKVLIVENQQSPNLRILYEQLFQAFDTKFVSMRNISSENFSNYQSIIFVGLTSISSGLSDRLQTFFNEGGGVLVFPGENVDLPSLNAFFQTIGMGSFSPLVNIQDGNLALNVDLAHPVFEGIFTQDKENQEFDAPNVYKYYPITLDNRNIHDKILSLSSQELLLVESNVSNGLLFTFATFPDDGWTDLHVKSIFAPLLFKTTQILNQTQRVQSRQELGIFEPYAIRSNKNELIKLVSDEQELIPEQFNRNGAIQLKFEKLSITEGNYLLVQEDSLLENISFNIPDLESKLEFAGQPDLAEELIAQGYSGINILAALPDTIADQIKLSKEGYPLWKYLIWLALLFLAIEVLLLRFKTQ